MHTKYTVLMSVYYREKPEFLSISIESMLRQTIFPDEFLIVEDGKLTDDLYSVIDNYVQKYPDLFTIIKLPKNGGLGPALKIGVEKSKNELIARMDSDDFSVPDRCERELKVFNQNPNMDIVGSFEAEFIENKNNVVAVHKVPEKNKDIATFMRRRCAILHPTVMYRKSAVIKSGNYHSVPLYEDYDLFSRMVLEHKVESYNIQENLYYIRTSPDFYKRRGGIKYAKTALNFKWGLYKKGYMSLTDFFISGIGQAVVCVLPNSVRKIIYLKVLR